jgi:hypothetical protein
LKKDIIIFSHKEFLENNSSIFFISSHSIL